MQEYHIVQDPVQEGLKRSSCTVKNAKSKCVVQEEGCRSLARSISSCTLLHAYHVQELAKSVQDHMFL